MKLPSRASNKDRVLQYGTVAASLLKDIGNATNQPYLQAIASVSLLIMETVQRVRDNKDACMKMTERAYELVCAIINICRDSEADLAPAMVRSIAQFSETLEKILVFVRNQVQGGLLRRMFRSMEDASLIQECNTGLKHALDVFGVQSGIIAAMTMAEMQKEAKQRHEELIAILNEKRSKSKRSSTDGSSSSRKKRPSSLKTDRSSTVVSMLPASPKIFYGRDEEVQHLTKLITLSQPARIALCGPEGIGKTSLALATSHTSEAAQLFGPHRYFIECDAAHDAKQLVAVIAAHLGLEGRGRKHVIRHLASLATTATTEEGKTEGEVEGKSETEGEKQKEKTRVLVVLDALDSAWKPHETRSDVEDFLSLLADLQHVTVIVTLRGGERPRQVKWTRPFLPTLHPLPAAATRATFLDISDVRPSSDAEDEIDADLERLLEITENHPATVTYLAGLASFEGCSALVARWEQEGSALLLDRAGRKPQPKNDNFFPDGTICEEPEEMEMEELLALLEPDACSEKLAPMPSIDTLLKEPTPTMDSILSRRGSIDTLFSRTSLSSVQIQSSRGSGSSSGCSRQSSLGTLNNSRSGSDLVELLPKPDTDSVVEVTA
ncbi:hypothetical protein K438DRAFT_1768940 [Mycena galopus ATCC 62051]|nr:hypothetical protein K438DRAFT_1768940 [Mycena galopus ATCC 62051]